MTTKNARFRPKSISLYRTFLLWARLEFKFSETKNQSCPTKSEVTKLQTTFSGVKSVTGHVTSLGFKLQILNLAQHTETLYRKIGVESKVVDSPSGIDLGTAQGSVTRSTGMSRYRLHSRLHFS